MFDNVVFTGTINLGGIITAVIALLGAVTLYLREKTSTEKTRRLIQEENAKTRACVHSIPGHPENPQKDTGWDHKGEAGPPGEV